MSFSIIKNKIKMTTKKMEKMTMKAARKNNKVRPLGIQSLVPSTEILKSFIIKMIIHG